MYNKQQFIAMKKTISTLALVAVALFFFACSAKPSGPHKATKNFTENMAQGKTDEAKKYATESTGKLIDFMIGMGGKNEVNPDYEFQFVKDSIVDNKAWVTFIDQDGKEETVEVVKIDGDWLVNMEAKK
jgi:hypothetical protein